jgi:hypothetical protein
MVLIPLSIQNVYSPAGAVPLSSHLTSCTPTKSSIYLESSLETVIREPALYELQMFRVPNLMSLFCYLGPLSKESVQVRGSSLLNLLLYGDRLLAPRLTPKLEDHTLSFVHGCLFNIFATNRVPPATRGRAMLWWQGESPNGSGQISYEIKSHILRFSHILNSSFISYLPFIPLCFSYPPLHFFLFPLLIPVSLTSRLPSRILRWWPRDIKSADWAWQFPLLMTVH